MLCFLAANFVLLGFIVGVWLLFRPRRIVVKNSAVYFDLPARTLLLLALAAYVLALLILRLYEKHAGRSCALRVDRRYRGAPSALLCYWQTAVTGCESHSPAHR